MFGKILSLTVNICAYEFKVYSFLYVIKYIIVNDYLCHLCGVILTLKSNGCDKDKVVGFTQPTAEDIEVHALADHDKIAEMMRGPRNHIPHQTQAKYKMPIIPLDNAFNTSPADVPGPRKLNLHDADITSGTRSAFDALCEKYPKVFSKGNEDIGRTQLVTMDIDMGDSPTSQLKAIHLGT